jgi:hypothetical protein
MIRRVRGSARTFARFDFHFHVPINVNIPRSHTDL